MTLAMVLMLLIVLVLLARTLDRLHPSRPRMSASALRDDHAGTATLEFAFVLPFVLFVGLALTQATLMMGGQLIVHYAAYAATRSAVTVIPADYGQGESHNLITPGSSSGKMGVIRRAAVYAVAPAGGRLQAQDGAPTEAYVEGLRSYYQSYGQNPPRWITTLAADRLRYAQANTRVVLVRTEVDGQVVRYTDLDGGVERFGPREAVTVRLEHRLHLAVPYIRGFFADGRHDADTGQGAYVDMTAQHTLINHGIVPALPPRPRLPRFTPDDPS